MKRGVGTLIARECCLHYSLPFCRMSELTVDDRSKAALNQVIRTLDHEVSPFIRTQSPEMNSLSSMEG